MGRQGAREQVGRRSQVGHWGPRWGQVGRQGLRQLRDLAVGRRQGARELRLAVGRRGPRELRVLVLPQPIIFLSAGLPSFGGTPSCQAYSRGWGLCLCTLRLRHGHSAQPCAMLANSPPSPV